MFYNHLNFLLNCRHTGAYGFGCPSYVSQSVESKIPIRILISAEQISKLRASQSPIAISLSRCPTWSSLDTLRFTGYWDNEANGILLNNGSTGKFLIFTPSIYFPYHLIATFILKTVWFKTGNTDLKKIETYLRL